MSEGILGDTLLSFQPLAYITENFCPVNSGLNLSTMWANQASLPWNTGLP